MNDSTVPTRLPDSGLVSGATQHYDGCPCGGCQALRATQPVTTAMQARHLSGASLGKLIAWDMGQSLTTGERQWSPTAMLGSVSHGEGWVELGLEWDADGEVETEQQLHPDEWVRVTQVPAREEAA